jgi:sec-independent protein translocase protein TatB
MFGVDTSEFIVLLVVALLFIGPKELPKAMMTLGRWIGKLRGYARHFTSGVENVIREAELEEMEKTWREENLRIMGDHPPDAHYPEPETIPLAPPRVNETEPGLPFEAPAAPDDDPTPASERPLP